MPGPYGDIVVGMFAVGPVGLSSSAIFSFWDALVVVAAARSGAKRVYTEDLQAGQVVLGVEVVNPFASESAGE